MIKEAPSPLRLLAMVMFTLSVFGLLLFLWLAFGGSIPLRPEGYRLQVAFPEAATLAEEADVRLAGVNVGKVKSKELARGGKRTLVEIELEEQYAPIPRDSAAVLRQKTLLGETYVELAAGHRSAGALEDGGRLSDARVEPTVELDEITGAFDEETREAFQEWVSELAKAIEGGRGQDLNDAFGNLEGFAVDGADLLKVLDDQGVAVRRLIRNTGVVFGALNEREGQLRELILNSNDTFEATASRDEALAETFRVFPTFLDESRATLARLERFSGDTRPLVRDLRGPADDLGPTVRDLGDLAPDLESLFRDLKPLIRTGRRGLPQLERFLRAGEPVFEAGHPFFQELNPILSLLSFHRATVAGFLTNAAADLSGDFGGQRYQTQFVMFDPRSFESFRERPDFERGNAYRAPNSDDRDSAFGTIESFDCKPSGGERRDPVDGPTAGDKRPPCFVQPPSLFNRKRFTRLERGEAPVRDAPQGGEGIEPPGVD
jgi:phospholipid/cholesterol/gamma-HCH transport system substrate-binding protein